MDFIGFFKSQLKPLPQPTASFTGQTVIVTGSNIGLGLEAARHFARLDAAKVILAVRSITKGEEAAKSIHDSVCRENVCEVWQVDMGNWQSIQDFAKRVAGLERVDAVVENAGVIPPGFSLLEGFETTVAVNVVGTFLLALLLLPTLRSMASKHGITPRIAIVTSELHAAVRWSPHFIGELGILIY
jgi:retinol dehydrogenase-12